jgi:hypothetical protein
MYLSILSFVIFETIEQRSVACPRLPPLYLHGMNSLSGQK